MARNTSIIPKAPCGRILQKAGAPRVSDEASAAFSEIIEEIAGISIYEEKKHYDFLVALIIFLS